MFVNPTFDPNSAFNSPCHSAVDGSPRGEQRTMDENSSRRVTAPAARDRERAALQVSKKSDVFAMRPAEKGEQREREQAQGSQVTLGVALSQRLKGVIDARSMPDDNLDGSTGTQMADKALRTHLSISEQQSSLPIRAVREGNNSDAKSASERGCTVASHHGEVPGQSPLLERFLSATDPALIVKLSESSSGHLPDDSLTPTAQPVFSPSKPAAKRLPTIAPSSSQTPVDHVDETPRVCTWSLPTHEHVASLSHSISLAHDPRTRATGSASNASSPGVTQRPCNQPAPPALDTGNNQPTSLQNTISPLDTMSWSSQLLVPIEALNHLPALTHNSEGSHAPTFTLAQPSSIPLPSPTKQPTTALQRRLQISPTQSPSKAPGTHQPGNYQSNRPLAVPVLPVPLPSQELSQGPLTAPSPGWTLAPSEWTVDDRAGGGSLMDGLSGVISRSSSTKVSSVCASNPNSSPAALPLRLRYGATPSPEGEWEHACISPEVSVADSFPTSRLSPDSSESMLSPAAYGPGQAKRISQDAATQMSPLQGPPAANATLQGGKGSEPLRKRFGGFFDNVNDPRSSYMSAATADTAVTVTESAVTAGTPEPSGSSQSSPRISPLSEAALREHSRAMPPVEELGSPHATGPTSVLTSPNKSATSSPGAAHYPPSRPHSPMVLPDHPARIDPTSILPSALLSDPFPADAFAGALRMCAVAHSTPEDTALLGGSLSLAQCMPASRTTSAIASATSKATSPENSGEADVKATPSQPTISPTPVAVGPSPPAAKTAVKRSPMKAAAHKPRVSTTARSQRSAVTTGAANTTHSSGIGSKSSNTGRSSPGPSSDSTAGGRTVSIRIATSAQQRRSLGGPQSRGTRAVAKGPQSGTKSSAGARSGAVPEVRGIPSRAGSKSPGPNVNLHRANLRLQETLNLSTTSSVADSVGDMVEASPASVPHTPAPTPTSPSPPAVANRWAANSTMPPVPSPLSATQLSPEVSKKAAALPCASDTSHLAAAKHNMKVKASACASGRGMKAEGSVGQDEDSKDGGVPVSPHSVSDAEVTVDTPVPTHAHAVSSGLPGCRLSPYCESVLAQHNVGEAPELNPSMREDSATHDQEQRPANMQDVSPLPHIADMHVHCNKLPEASGSKHAYSRTPPHVISCSVGVSQPTTCPSTVDLVPVSDADACGSCITDGDTPAQCPAVTPFGVASMPRYPTPLQTHSASPPDDPQTCVPEISPVLPLLGPIVTPISSVASAVMHDPHAYNDTPDSVEEFAAAASHSGESSYKDPHPHDDLAESSSTAVGARASDSAHTQPGVAEQQPERPVQHSTKCDGGDLVDPPVLPRGPIISSCSLSLAGPDALSGAAGVPATTENTAEAAVVVASPLLISEPLTCIVDARDAAASATAEYEASQVLHRESEVDMRPQNPFQPLPEERGYEGVTVDEEHDWDICDGEMTEKRLSNLASASAHGVASPGSDDDDLAHDFGARHAVHALESPAQSAGSTSAPRVSCNNESQSGLGGSMAKRSTREVYAAAAANVGTVGRNVLVKSGLAEGAIDRETFVSDQLHSTDAGALASVPSTPAGIKSLENYVLNRLEGEESAASAPTPVSLGDQRGVGTWLENASDGALTMDELAPVEDILAAGTPSSRVGPSGQGSSGLEVQITNIVCASTQSSYPGSGLPSAVLPASRNKHQLQLQLGEGFTQQDLSQSPLPNAIYSADSPTERLHEAAVISPAAVVVPNGFVSGHTSAESARIYGESENLDDYSGAGSTTQYNSIRAASLREGAAVPSDSSKGGSSCVRASVSRSSLCDVTVATSADALHEKEEGHMGVGEAAESLLESLEGSKKLQEENDADAAASLVTRTCGSVEAAVGIEVALHGANTLQGSVGPDAIFDSSGSETQSACMQHAVSLVTGTVHDVNACTPGRPGGFGIGGLSLQIVDLSENPISLKMQTPEELGAVGGSPRLSPRRLSHGTSCRHHFVPSVQSDDDDVSLTSTADLDAMSTIEAAAGASETAHMHEDVARSAVTTTGVRVPAIPAIGMGLGLAIPSLMSVKTLDRAKMNSSPGPPSARTLVSPNMPLVPASSMARSVVPEEHIPHELGEDGADNGATCEVPRCGGEEEQLQLDIAVAGAQAAVDLNMHAFNRQRKSEMGQGTDECSTGDLTGFIGGPGASARLGPFDTSTTHMSGMHMTPPASPGGSMSRTPSGMLSPAGAMHMRSRSGLLSTAGAEAAEAAAIEAAFVAAQFVPPKLTGEGSFCREYEDTWNEAMEGLGDALQHAAETAAMRAERKRLKQERNSRRTLSGFGLSGQIGTPGSFVDGATSGGIGASPRHQRLSFGAGSLFSGDISGANGPRSLPPNMYTPTDMAASGAMFATPSTPSSVSQGCGAQGVASGAPDSTGAVDGVPGALGPCMSAQLAGGEYSFSPAMSEGGLSRHMAGDFDQSGVSASVLNAEMSEMSFGGSSLTGVSARNGGKLKRMKKNLKASFKKFFGRKKPAPETSSQTVGIM